jgi:hypothetical protein
MVIAGFDVKPYIGALLAIVFIFAGIFSAANLVRNLGHWVAAKDAVERGQWAWRWLRPALALLLCAIATYIVFLYLL